MRDFYGVTLQTPMMLGTARYPSPSVMEAAFISSGASVATVSLRRERGAGQAFWDMVRGLGVHLLPNTAGCHSAREAITTAQMAREYFQTDWIKLEVIGHADTLQPDPFGLVEAAEALCADGFNVFPYTTEDQVLASRLVEAGCRVLMPWGAPIGSGMGLNNIHGLRTLRAAFPDVAMVIDAGLGLPSHAAQAMELGFDAVLLNTAVAEADDPVAMARAFGLAAQAGALAATAGPMGQRDMAAPSTPLIGKAWL
ncbi:thiazole synthase [Sulfitobacter guttiformis]|uniref:Thiazole synthase n=1 Tax=Sulfitobacter guttiformis TaxID=74349 RepID=A0A420DQS9_9RHOB|nr:thiazole synthase [Sulfitobacter guttiformis]KIN73906.1 Thiazole synthase [Sulfitobacter guttiformis KCTC 32187]RKE96538.1 thiazole-phosphate synthase [Sulfitobacter guttiformis]